MGEDRNDTPLLGVGNLAACRSVKMYLANVREEQLKARVTPHQADPILVWDLALISNHIEHMLLHKANSAIQIFVHARDQALLRHFSLLVTGAWIYY